MQLPRRSARRVATAIAAALATVLSGLLAAPAAHAANVATPGNFTGYGFDQCHTPSQEAMDAWLTSSPYWAVGIYISGDSRFCLDQPNLTADWVTTQLRNRWRLLPITLGPQAWCTTRERYLKQVRITPDPTDGYAKARAQGRAEAVKTVGRATDLGIAPGSTLWYDIEAFDISKKDCRESALSFLSAWTNKMHGLGYVSGVYSSAGSGIKMLDDARVNRPGAYAMPDQIWVARWSGEPGEINTDGATYLREDGWMPHARVHQYLGGHDETHGGVRINIDSNWLDVGRGTVAPREPSHCGGVSINFTSYTRLVRGSTGPLVRAAQCLLREKRFYTGKITGRYDSATSAAVRAFRAKAGVSVGNDLNRAVWTALLAQGPGPLMKYGAGSHAVRRLQRALNAADGAGLKVTGVFEARTTAAVKRYQADHKLGATGVVTTPMWGLLRAGKR